MKKICNTVAWCSSSCDLATVPAFTLPRELAAPRVSVSAAQVNIGGFQQKPRRNKLQVSVGGKVRCSKTAIRVIIMRTEAVTCSKAPFDLPRRKQHTQPKHSMTSHRGSDWYQKHQNAITAADRFGVTSTICLTHTWYQFDRVNLLKTRCDTNWVCWKRYLLRFNGKVHQIVELVECS